MNIENEIFKKAILNRNTLISYGFIKNKNYYEYSKNILNNSFKTIITIDENGNVSGKLYDLNIGDEYTNFRIESQIGEFVSTVREEYKNILNDIRNKCFEEAYFNSMQANRITKKIIDLYGDKPEFILKKSPEYGIFKNSSNDKWYAIIMNIDRNKIDKKNKGKVEVINVKLDNDQITSLLRKKGFYLSYHMNKNNWITIILDNTISDEEIMFYISISHKYTETNKEWIIPANPKYYDLITDFEKRNIIEWKQSNDIRIGDIVYLYVAAPYSALLYKCEAVEVNIPHEYKDKNLSMNRIMKIKLLEKYNEKQYPFSKLNEFGVKAIRGPRTMPEALSKEINN